jgi:alkylhydroperoxidase domain protein/CMD domain protein
MMTTAATQTDVISALAGIQPGSPLAKLRAQRPEAMQHAQGSYRALFAPEQTNGLTHQERFATALRVASRHAAPEAIAHYRQQLLQAGATAEVVTAVDTSAGDAPAAASPRLRAILAHADLLGTHPVDAAPDHLQALADAGLTTTQIVVLSQIIAFISFQVRVIRALQLIGGQSSNGAAPETAAASQPGTAASPSSTASDAPSEPPATITRPGADLNRPPAFTRDQLEWTPWLDPIEMDDATPEQRAALEGRRGNSPYFRLLARDATVLSERTATDMGIFYTHGGAPRPERELAAAATSRLNGCIYCASVHARLSGQLSKREADIDRMLDRGVSSIPDLGLDPRWQAVVELAVNLARTPSTATVEHIARLRQLGLADLEILDIAQSAAFFSWANRLMLTLGEPYISA